METAPVAGLCLLCLAAAPACAENVILVEDSELLNPAVQTWLPEELELSPPADGGELLRDLPGIAGRRLGGRGIDPIIRGQSRNRLNILLDGAYVFGGCPNRMDPPTTYSSMNAYDSMTVIKGNQTVIYGGGGPGGTVLFERITPRFYPGEQYRASASSGYISNSDTWQAGADVAVGNSDGYLRSIVDYIDANNYEDGDGNTVRSAYTNKDGVILLGYTPTADTVLELSYEANREDDVLFAGAGMDSPYSDNDTTRLRFETGSPVGFLDSVEAELYYSEIDHLMDNYSLRPLTAPMKMRAPSSSDTGGGRFIGGINTGNGVTWTLGTDYQKNNRKARRYSGPPSGGKPENLQSILWPDVDLAQTGVFAEMTRPLTDRDLLTAGARYDYVDTSAGSANETALVAVMPGPPPMPVYRSPEDLYAIYYGTRDDDHTEHNIGGFVTLRHTLENASAVYATLSRSVRTADATERYIASDSGMDTSMRWIGNPDLDPEAHHQLELGYTRDAGFWDTTASVYYNDVSDYILRDRAHGQSGILQDDNATIYRNVDAEFYGFEMEAGIRWGSFWSSRATLAYVHAENTTDNRAIAQIPPLGGTVSLEYARADWNLGALLRADARQDRVEDDIFTDSGQDADKTPGWATLDLFGGYEAAEYVTVAAGVNNVFDRNYAYHVNAANMDPFNPTAIQVNEPGRAYWVRLNATF
ncbi:MAG: TonB-dependent copper receptor [Gammaproteobacteria bacterium]|jgi:iron complex outermembrane receptor protein